MCLLRIKFCRLDFQMPCSYTVFSTRGDSGYPLKPYLLTPYRNPADSSAEQQFNKKHVLGREIIERCSGTFKNRFRCLIGARGLHYTPEKAKKVIHVCAALHNICIKYDLSEPTPPDIYQDNDDNEPEDDPLEISNDDSPLGANPHLLRDENARSIMH
ncbi:putative nuclease HARBI1 [Teleopsis dalmanni]|uniref:putative nuclease HARBI1 n=1 Tax=Teleopsis dalmanni TaxID=139649 RepID=UPI0018CF087D|nr:putative nuclease HARBI1 [Teleopsis dalmanni]XP_037942581.1 putative nuclease HARBI1 [Teleopsis dalmanni]